MSTPRSHAIYAAQGAYSLFIHRAYVVKGFEAPSNLDGYRFTDSRSGYVVILRRNGACDASATRLANLPGAEPVEATPRRAPALPISIMPRALWSFPASRVGDAIDGATDWLCSMESFGFDGSEALATLPRPPRYANPDYLQRAESLRSAWWDGYAEGSF